MVQTFLCYVGNVDEDMIKKGLSLLPVIEKEKIMCIRSEKQKRLSLASKLLLQKKLKERGHTLLDCVSQKNGKPKILKDENFHFNVSHSGEYVLLAVSPLPVGADIEQIRESLPKGLQRILSEEEMKILECLSEQEKNSFFFQLWTRKESYVKCLGQRIFTNPFLLSMVEKGILCNRYKDCFFHSYDLEGYSISLCSFDKIFSSAVNQMSFYDLLFP